MGLNEDLGDRENIGSVAVSTQRAREQRLDQVKRTYPFLDPDFLTLMNDIGRLGHEKFGSDAFEATGGKRQIDRHKKDAIVYHARGHITNYLLRAKHDEFKAVRAHLAAAAFNCMLEYIFSQGE